jgi:hypothetical protein
MEDPQSTFESQPGTPAPTMSLWGRMLNVFAAPGDVFEEVKTAKISTANWLVPALLLVAVSWVAVAVIYSQPPLQQQLRETIDQAIQKQVERTHMSQQQAEQARATGEKWASVTTKAGASLGPLISAFVTPFFWGVIIWVVGAQVLKARLPYMKAVEVVGLANMISVLDAIVRTLLIVGLGNLYASPSLVLLVKNFDPQNTVHGLLPLANVMTFWLLAVRASALARLASISYVKAAAWVFGIWAGYTGVFVGLGLLARAVFKNLGGGGG